MTGAAVLALSLIAFVALGVPIAFSIILAALSGTVFYGIGSFAAIPSTMFGGVNSFTLMAIPMFALMGEIMAQTSLGTKFINIASALVGWIKGGLSMATVVVCMMFGTISGSSVAAAAALTGMLVPEMDARGYPKPLSVAVMSSASTLAIIIPPSSALILYGVAANVSISTLYLAAIIPGILSGLLLMFVAYGFALKLDLPIENSFSARHLLKTLADGWATLMIPAVIFGGIFGGVFTPTEAAAVATMVALFGGIRELGLAKIPKILVRTALSTAIVTFMVAGSSVLVKWMTLSRAPQLITSTILSLTDNVTVIMLALCLMLFILGMLLHGNAIILLVVPLALPIVKTLGVNLVQFGLILCLFVGIGQQTPPVASVLITTCSLAKVSIPEAWPYLKWFLMSAIVATLLVTFIPWFSTCLL